MEGLEAENSDTNNYPFPAHAAAVKMRHKINKIVAGDSLNLMISRCMVVRF